MKEFLSFILWALAAIGFGHILVDGSILISFKEWLGDPKKRLSPQNYRYPKWVADKLLQLMSCYQCSGWWGGFITAIMMHLSAYKALHWLSYLLYAFAASFLCSLGAVLIQYLNFSEKKHE